MASELILRTEQVQRQHVWLSGQFNGISNGITRFKTAASGMTKIQNKVMTTMLSDAYDRLFLFVEQLSLLPDPKTRFGREHQKVWSTLGAAEKAFGNVVWELERATEGLNETAMGAMQEGDTVEAFLKRWHDFQQPLSGEADSAQNNAEALTYKDVAREVERETHGINEGFDELQRIVNILSQRKQLCESLKDALHEVDRQMTRQFNQHPHMDTEYDEMYNKIIDDKNYASDISNAIQLLSGSALEIDNPLSTRDGAVDYLVKALEKEKHRDQHGGRVVTNGVERISKLLDARFGKHID